MLGAECKLVYYFYEIIPDLLYFLTALPPAGGDPGSTALLPHLLHGADHAAQPQARQQDRHPAQVRA